MSLLRCAFYVVPDPSVRGEHRVVRCNRLREEHPVADDGYYVDHQRFLSEEESDEIARAVASR